MKSTGGKTFAEASQEIDVVRIVIGPETKMRVANERHTPVHRAKSVEQSSLCGGKTLVYPRSTGAIRTRQCSLCGDGIGETAQSFSGKTPNQCILYTISSNFPISNVKKSITSASERLAFSSNRRIHCSSDETCNDMYHSFYRQEKTPSKCFLKTHVSHKFHRNQLALDEEVLVRFIIQLHR